MASFQRRYDVVRCRVSTGVMHISDIYFYVTNSALSKNEAFKKSMLKRLNLKSFEIKDVKLEKIYRKQKNGSYLPNFFVSAKCYEDFAL